MWRQAVPLFHRNSLPTQCRFIPAAAGAGQKNLRLKQSSSHIKENGYKTLCQKRKKCVSQTDGIPPAGAAGSAPASGPDLSISHRNGKCKSFLIFVRQKIGQSFPVRFQSACRSTHLLPGVKGKERHAMHVSLFGASAHFRCTSHSPSPLRRESSEEIPTTVQFSAKPETEQ